MTPVDTVYQLYNISYLSLVFMLRTVLEWYWNCYNITYLSFIFMLLSVMGSYWNRISCRCNTGGNDRKITPFSASWKNNIIYHKIIIHRGIIENSKLCKKQLVQFPFSFTKYERMIILHELLYYGYTSFGHLWFKKMSTSLPLLPAW